MGVAPRSREEENFFILDPNDGDPSPGRRDAHDGTIERRLTFVDVPKELAAFGSERVVRNPFPSSRVGVVPVFSGLVEHDLVVALFAREDVVGDGLGNLVFGADFPLESLDELRS